MNMRAKMRVTSVEQFGASERVNMTAVSKSSYTDDGSDEDNTYAKFSPAGTLSLTIANPALIGAYHANDVFYVDFTPVPAVQ